MKVVRPTNLESPTTCNATSPAPPPGTPTPPTHTPTEPGVSSDYDAFATTPRMTPRDRDSGDEREYWANIEVWHFDAGDGQSHFEIE